MAEKPNYDGDFDYEEDAQERDLLMDDLASDTDDFASSVRNCGDARMDHKAARRFLDDFSPLRS